MKRYIHLILIAFFVNLFAEKVSLHDATNAAINYYRESVVPRQIEKGIITDYKKAIDLDSIRFEIDSLIYGKENLYYYFNFKPTGYVAVRSLDNLRPIAEFSVEGKIYSYRVHDRQFGRRFYYLFKNSMNKKPDSVVINQWNYYKVDPKEFKITKPFVPEKVSLQDATNAAINYYRESLVNWQIEKKVISDYNRAIDLNNLKFEIDSLIYENKNLFYIFNFKPEGYIHISPYIGIHPILDFSVDAYFNKNTSQYIKKYFEFYENHVYQEPVQETIDQWEKYIIDPKQFILTTDKVSLTDATNVAINFYRWAMVPRQLKKEIVTDYETAVNLDSIKFEVDSLMWGNQNLYYCFNFKPKGWMHISSLYSRGPVIGHEESYNTADMQTIKNANSDPYSDKIFGMNSQIGIYKKYKQLKPNLETIKKWNELKVDPKEYKFERLFYARDVSLDDATNVAINFYRQNIVPLQLKKGIVSGYENVINLDSIKFEVDYLVDQYNPVGYIFNFKPDGWLWVGATYSNDPVPNYSIKGQSSVEMYYVNGTKYRYENVDLDILEAMKRKRKVIPDSILEKKWDNYKVDPKEFKIEK